MTTSWSAEWLRKVARRLSFRRAWRQVWRDRRRTSSSIVAVALGVSAVVALRLTSAGVRDAFVASATAAAGRVTFSVVADGGASFSRNVVSRIAAVDGVAQVVPVIRGTVFVNDGSGEALTVHAFDLTDRDAFELYGEAHTEAVVEDEFTFLNGRGNIIVGEEFAARRGLHRHDRLELLTPAGVETFSVEGVIEARGFGRALGGRLLLMDVFAAERAFAGRDMVTQVDVRVADPNRAGAVRMAVEGVLAVGLRARDLAEQQETIRRGVRGFEGLLLGFGLLVVLAGFVICLGRLSTVLSTRSWEGGVLRALGMSQRAVASELAKEALLLGVNGAALGCGLGFVIARGAVPMVAGAMALTYRWWSPDAHVRAQAEPLLLGALTGLAAVVFAAARPTMRLAATAPMTVLRQRYRIETIAPPFRLTWGGGLVLLAVVLVGVQLRWASVPLGILTTGVLIVAVVGWTAAAISGAGRMLASIHGRGALAIVRMAGRRLAARPRGATFVAATIAVGVGAIVLFLVLARSFEYTVVSRATASVSADLVVSSARAGAGYRAAPVSDAVVHEVGALAEVASAGGTQSTDTSYGSVRVTLKAYDAILLHDPRLFRWPLGPDAAPDALATIERGEGALVSVAFAEQFRTRAGDTLQLASPSGPQQFRVVGIAFGQPETAIVIERGRYRQAWNDTLIGLTYVAVRAGVSAEDATQAIERTLGARYGLQIRTGGALVEHLGHEVHRAFEMFYIVGALVLLVVVVAVVDAVAGTVADRRRELAVLRALGVRPRDVVGLIVFEEAIVAAVGLLLAIAVGLVLGAFWVYVQFPALIGWRLDPALPWRPVGGALVATLALCAGGAAWPSVRALRISPAGCLRSV